MGDQRWINLTGNNQTELKCWRWKGWWWKSSSPTSCWHWIERFSNTKRVVDYTKRHIARKDPFRRDHHPNRIPHAHTGMRPVPFFLPYFSHCEFHNEYHVAPLLNMSLIIVFFNGLLIPLKLRTDRQMGIIISVSQNVGHTCDPWGMQVNMEHEYLAGFLHTPLVSTIY